LEVFIYSCTFSLTYVFVAATKFLIKLRDHCMIPCVCYLRLSMTAVCYLAWNDNGKGNWLNVGCRNVHWVFREYIVWLFIIISHWSWFYFVSAVQIYHAYTQTKVASMSKLKSNLPCLYKFYFIDVNLPFLFFDSEALLFSCPVRWCFYWLRVLLWQRFVVAGMQFLFWFEFLLCLVQQIN
jgi:hypothetical protein